LFKQHTPILFFQKKKGKKRKPFNKWKDAKMQGQRRNGAVYIPLLLCQPGTYICFPFLFFGLIITVTTFGVVVGVLVDRHNSKGL